MELSEAAKSYVFQDGEYAGKKPSEMLDEYQVIMLMGYLLRCSWVSSEVKNIYKELCSFKKI